MLLLVTTWWETPAEALVAGGILVLLGGAIVKTLLNPPKAPEPSKALRAASLLPGSHGGREPVRSDGEPYRRKPHAATSSPPPAAPPAATRPDSLAETVAWAGEHDSMLHLVGWDKMPAWLQFNRFVQGRYRKMAPARRVWITYLTLHNESFNIWSHALCLAAFVYLALDVYSTIPTGPTMESVEHHVWILVNVITCAFTCVGSMWYHGMMPATHTADAYDKLLRSDLVGVWFGVTGAAIPLIMYGFGCTPVGHTISRFFLGTMLVGGTQALLGAMFSSTAEQRGAHIIRLVFLRNLPWLMRPFFIGFVITSRLGFWLHAVAMSLTVVGGVVNVKRWPECWWQGGVFDLWFNSHNLWHIASALASLGSVIGAVVDQEFWLASGCGLKSPLTLLDMPVEGVSFPMGSTLPSLSAILSALWVR